MDIFDMFPRAGQPARLVSVWMVAYPGVYALRAYVPSLDAALALMETRIQNGVVITYRAPGDLMAAITAAWAAGSGRVSGMWAASVGPVEIMPDWEGDEDE